MAARTTSQKPRGASLQLTLEALSLEASYAQPNQLADAAPTTNLKRCGHPVFSRCMALSRAPLVAMKESPTLKLGRPQPSPRGGGPTQAPELVSYTTSLGMKYMGKMVKRCRDHRPLPGWSRFPAPCRNSFCSISRSECRVPRASLPSRLRCRPFH